MPKEINEDFGLDDRNFHPEEQLIHSASTKKENKKSKQDKGPKPDKDFDDALDEELENHSDQGFDKKDKSDS
ncbi:hypothetical protein SAMN05444397_101812 [Flavobacterium aquidurense]|uniref:Uncharacterized protein n=1 Tax=Flavobacterium frigidimaris TaxID=262320 RepID=A0ABX4BJ41_FLAFR|nr:hypothetical protein [Flavobacterium frigidimaris]OXA75128.1 hypothetical protein B0A65_22665 [Flavobacterium frigidimaris]SDY50862.1 hypothetical protein SAMN05444397_101812 [Flavobacterium aquidurense]